MNKTYLAFIGCFKIFMHTYIHAYINTHFPSSRLYLPVKLIAALEDVRDVITVIARHEMPADLPSAVAVSREVEVAGRAFRAAALTCVMRGKRGVVSGKNTAIA